MSKIRHFSLEQTPSPPERLPRLVPPPALSNPMSLSQRQSTGDTLDALAPNIPPRYPGRRTSEEITPKTRHPSDQLANSQVTSSSPTQKYQRNLYVNSNTYTGDGRRPWNTILPSVISGVAITSFQGESQTNGEDAEKRKKFSVKEFRQRRRERRDSKNISISDSDSNAVSLTNFNNFATPICQMASICTYVCTYLTHTN
nr:hypothetical protein HmN_000927600 [Hymenolepis microstoma]CUU98299.1 hypothetical transcript [Hymenolepis microstoma]